MISRFKHNCFSGRSKSATDACTLAEAGCGRRLRVNKLMGNDDFKSKMIEQGIFPGSEISLVCGRKDHPCVVSSGDNTIMIDSASADLILVSPDK